MSEEESESTDGLEILTDEEDAAKDYELMKDILKSIESTKHDKPSCSESPSKLEAVNDGPCSTDEPNVIFIDSMELASLNMLLDQLNEALEFNQVLQNALIMKEVKLISLQRRLLAMKTRETDNQDFFKDKEDELKGDIGKYIVKFKAPYFKDSKNFAGYTVVPRGSFPTTVQHLQDRAVEWKSPDLKELENHVRKFLAGVQFSSMFAENEQFAGQSRAYMISKYKKNRKKATLSELVPENFDQIVDWCTIASRLRKPHTPYECQKAWEIFLKPSLNRKPWRNKEKEQLKDIALEHNYEDWDLIAEKLGSSRSGYQCFHEFQDLISKVAEGDWSKDEEEYLIQLVKECSYGDKIVWHKVAFYFGTRSLNQIYRKWNLSAISRKYKSGPFSEHEDKVILTKMMKNESRATLNLVAHLLNRMRCQIRYRYTQLKTSLTLKYGEWTLEEDKLLMELIEKYGTKNWATVAQHIPSRDRIQVRHRHKHIKKRMQSTPGMKLEDFYRRKRTVHKKRKQATLKYVMNIAGVQDKSPPEGKDTINLETAVGNFAIRPEDLVEDTVEKRTRKRKPKKKHVEKQDSEELDECEWVDEPDAQDQIPSTSQSTSGLCDGNALQKAKHLKKFPGTLSSAAEDDEPIVKFYRQFQQYKGEPQAPKNCCDSRPDVDAISEVLGVKPYKYLDLKVSEWAYNVDKFDLYYQDVLEKAASSNDNNASSQFNSIARRSFLPPSVDIAEGFYNLLLDIDFDEEDINCFNPNELTTLYTECDVEMSNAVKKWKDRLKSVFLWPTVLSQLEIAPCSADLQEGSIAAVEQDVNAFIEMDPVPGEISESVIELENESAVGVTSVAEGVSSLSLNKCKVTPYIDSSQVALSEEGPAFQVKANDEICDPLSVYALDESVLSVGADCENQTFLNQID